jgi:hypothetical protein
MGCIGNVSKSNVDYWIHGGQICTFCPFFPSPFLPSHRLFSPEKHFSGGVTSPEPVRWKSIKWLNAEYVKKGLHNSTLE